VNLELVASPFAPWEFLLLGYLLGSIPFGYLLVRATGGGDIRKVGSGNIGATNVARTSGWAVGVATLVLDAAKGFLAVWLTEHFSGANIRFMMYAGLAAILGHVFPVWLKFAGGKGVATALGVFCLLFPKAILVSLAVFIVVVVVTRYVSLGSILGAIAFPIAAYFLEHPDRIPLLLTSVITLLVVLKHHQNISRLLSGTENRFGGSKAAGAEKTL